MTEKVDLADSHDPRKVRQVLSKPYDASRGTPTRADLLEKRDFVRDMMRFAWKGYKVQGVQSSIKILLSELTTKITTVLDADKALNKLSVMSLH